ncbi:MAG: thiamine-phosphate kinase [Gammaproteobacteria bacterium]|jgi:thiamine-monophosphate kinase|nr:thiamine-phosphate kinase [Gammaproteobacteria bacterium]
MTGTTEFSLIQKYFSYDFKRDDVALGIGDDCALLNPPSGKQLVMTVDTLVAGVHFPVATSAEDIGYKSLAVNLSDLAAMGAEPAWATLAITLPENDPEWLEKFSKSFQQTLHAHDVQLIGGDTTQGPLTITVQLTGFVDQGRAMRRDAAKPGDKIYLTGNLGDAALALKLLDVPDLPAPETRTVIIKKLNRPMPRVEFAQRVAEHCACAIDLSDGLIADLGHILKASHCGARVYFDRLPVSPEFRECMVHLDGFDFNRMILSGGDDYELCMVTSEKNESALFSLAESMDLLLTCIGEIDSSEALTVISSNGESMELTATGYQHFSHV